MACMSKATCFEVYFASGAASLHRLSDCDCACPSTAPATAPGALAPDAIIQRHPQQQHLALSDEYSVAYVPSFSQIAVLNREALHLLHRFSQPHSLAHLGAEAYATAQQLYHLGLLHLPGSEQPALPEPDTLVAWLHITNACNLQCSYCYVEQDRTMMSAETAMAAIDAVLRSAQRHGYRQVYLKYAGGEASLNLPLVDQAHRYACEQATAAGIVVQGTVLSNGVELDAYKLQRIRNLGLRLMLSLDGPQPFHDAQRPRHGGQGSFNAVVASIERARDMALDLTISVTVTSNNIAGLPELLEWLLARDIHFTLNFYREPEPRLTRSDNAPLQSDVQQLIDGMRAAYSIIAQRPPHYSVLGSLLDRTNLTAPHRHACPLGFHYLVIDQHGQVSRCQMDMQRPLTTVWDADPLGVLQRDQTPDSNLSVEHKELCRDCQWRYWCAGGCALMAHQTTGRYDTPSPHCTVYQALFPEVIRLEGLRLLHQVPPS
jgi:uncharacterized protein